MASAAGRRASAGSFALIGPIAWTMLIAIPLVYLILISLRSRGEYLREPLGLPTSPTLDNYITAWIRGGLGTAFLNNIIITVTAVTATVVLGSLASYGIARWKGRVGNVVFLYFALGLIVPFQLGLPALYKMAVPTGLVDTLAGVIIVHVGANLPLAIFLYTGFLLSVPLELEEAARVDGAGELRTFVSIVFPLLRPVTATVIILTSIGVWNDLIVALFLLQDRSKMPLARSLLEFMGQYNSDVPVIFAAAVLVVAPIAAVFFILQRHFVSGLTQGALRG